MVQTNSIKDKILIICGPTASGKTALSVEIAKRINGEIISADSMYIYKGLNVGTAKPTVEERCNIPHYLIDVIEFNEKFTVSDYRELAKNSISDVISRGKTPIIVGGTGFYINSILYNLSYGNGVGDEKVRQKYKDIAEKKGNQYVYDLLLEVDEESAKKLHPNDVKRVIRALEIYESGIKKSQLNDQMIPEYDYLAFCIDFDRQTLYKRIDKRVDLMIKQGLINEVKSLIEKGASLNNQCMQAIGYKEIYEYLTFNLSLDETVQKIKTNTRHYAKRQITFFKKMPNLEYLIPKDINVLAEEIINKYDRL